MTQDNHSDKEMMKEQNLFKNQFISNKVAEAIKKLINSRKSTHKQVDW